MDIFERAFTTIVGMEDGYSRTSADPGNWTGGAPNAGDLKGTKYGISAASYPTLDIANLTLDQAHIIYKRDYWDRIGADALVPRLALQLHFLIDMSPLRGGLMCSSPEGPSDDMRRLNASLREPDGDAADFLDRPTDQWRRALGALRFVFGGGVAFA